MFNTTLTRMLRANAESRSDAAKVAIADAKSAAIDFGLFHRIDNGSPRCLFDARGDECVVTIVNVEKFANAFRSAGFQEDRNMFEPAFMFSPDRMAEVAAIVNQ